MSGEYSAYSNASRECRWYGTACPDKNCCEGNGFTRCRENHSSIIRDKIRGEYHIIRGRGSENSMNRCWSFIPAGLERTVSRPQSNISA
jgi:hypothetical protein